MGMYSDLSDIDLADKIKDLRGALEDIAAGRNVRSVWGEDRRLEFNSSSTASQLKALRGLLRELNEEQERRGCGETFGAIGVVFP